jgi:hypothetical protein
MKAQMLRKNLQKMKEPELRSLQTDIVEELRQRELLRRWEERLGSGEVETEDEELCIIDRWSGGLKY